MSDLVEPDWFSGIIGAMLSGKHGQERGFLTRQRDAWAEIVEHCQCEEGCIKCEGAARGVKALEERIATLPQTEFFDGRAAAAGKP